MTTDLERAHADLAYLADVVREGRPFAYSTGVVYCAAGVVYGFQCLIALAHLSFWPNLLSPIGHLANAIVPTVLFIAVILIAPYIDKRRPVPKGPVQRAIAAGFSGTGLANMVLIIVIGAEAIRRRDMSIWLFYAVTVCALQGAVWYGAAILRRRWWMGAVSAGWLLTGLLAGLHLTNLPVFLLILTIGLFAFMAVPGYILIRITRPPG
jgi:hypothetical protein